MATITVRKLDPVTWEPQWGLGKANFISDIDAVAQIIRQRLQLLQNEWWENLLEGLPFWQSIAGYAGKGNSQQNISLIIQNRILSTPYVVRLSSVQATYTSSTRSFSFYAVVQTQFGSVVVTNMPVPPSGVLPTS